MRLRLVLGVFCFVGLAIGACVIGPKQDDPAAETPRTGDDGGMSVDSGSTELDDTGAGPTSAADAASDANDASDASDAADANDAPDAANDAPDVVVGDAADAD